MLWLMDSTCHISLYVCQCVACHILLVNMCDLFWCEFFNRGQKSLFETNSFLSLSLTVRQHLDGIELLAVFSMLSANLWYKPLRNEILKMEDFHANFVLYLCIGTKGRGWPQCKCSGELDFWRHRLKLRTLHNLQTFAPGFIQL